MYRYLLQWCSVNKAWEPYLEVKAKTQTKTSIESLLGLLTKDTMLLALCIYPIYTQWAIKDRIMGILSVT